MLFKLLNKDNRYTVVHLTWSAYFDSSGIYPLTTIYATWDDFYCKSFCQIAKVMNLIINYLIDILTINMEARELRLGNIVNVLDGSSWYQGTVSSIGESKCVIASRSVKVANIQGIRITDAWLMKSNLHEDYNDPNSNGLRYFGVKNFQLTLNEEVYYYKDTQIRYIHELQNLYFVITMEELVF